MRTLMPPQSGIALKPISMKSFRGYAGMQILLAGAIVIGSISSVPLRADQAQAPSSGNTKAHHPAHHKHHVAAHHAKPAPPPPPPPVAVAAPPAPEIPQWPVNDQPANAAITWDSQGLRIEAANSSLQQILKDVSMDTGAKVEGLASDERVFGAYGPGQARDVISQLLQGSGYNVIMIGDQGHGTPRQILLSARRNGDVQPGANNQQANPSSEDDTDSNDEQPPPPQFQPGNGPRPGFTPGGPPRTPQQQILQEMQRQQQQQQTQQPANPPN